ncbi:hypothetical protein GCM10007423_12030 [Dyadobacter endophyticus]|uniref:YopA central domain-containing protein n=1 Tax=Dyadobacter endophyticus TaxID=1749036 RepID=A0ABQ1YJB7_9BACT|nr:hypothetical protein [Dyadobacter endophyticus]GGH26781.1 hypothetical protein GCM10007423_12030 [Dyadobacter endophyticus]
MEKTDIPNGFPESLQQYLPNEPVIVYQGQFALEKSKSEILIEGLISFDWLPQPQLVFRGTADKSIHQDLLGFTLDPQPLRVRTADHCFGKGVVTQFTNNEFSGRIIDEKTVGDLSAKAERITFVIPNLKSISEEPVCWNGNQFSNNRLTLDNGDYSIVLEKSASYKQSDKELRNSGGYCIQYYGEATKKAGTISYDEAIGLASSLSSFLSFINGRRTSLLFLTGVSGQNMVWKDYATNHVDGYKAVSSWYHRDKQIDLRPLWKSFSDIWNDRKQSSNLKNVISFYLESNCNKVFIENCIVLSQAAMELLYNWQFVEKSAGKETDIAIVKLNKLIAHLKISRDIPKSLSCLKQLENITFVDKSFNPRANITSATEAYLEIRNAIIHGNAWRRENLDKIDTDARIEAWILGNWYIELSILRILGYIGLYNNRTVSMKIDYSCMEPVPWL